jgi:tellurite resistance protein
MQHLPCLHSRATGVVRTQDGCRHSGAERTRAAESSAVTIGRARGRTRRYGTPSAYRSGRLVRSLLEDISSAVRVWIVEPSDLAFPRRGRPRRPAGHAVPEAWTIRKRMTMAEKARSVRATRGKKREVDEALLALFIGAMNANGHVAREELARAHHLIWSTRRFRRKSGETVGRLIDRVKRLLEEQDAAAVIERAANAVPAGLRRSAFAVVTDLLLADGKIDGRERRFLQRLAASLGIPVDAAAQVVEMMLVKNHL